MVTSTSIRLWLLACATMTGCFADSKPAGDGTTGTSCPEGSSGCACYGNMTCDEALVCTDGYCLDPACVDGTENCPCLPSGGCDVGLLCDGTLCKPPGGTSSADASATTVEPLTTAAEAPGESGVMSTTTDTVTGPLEVGESSVSDTSTCMDCQPGEFCDSNFCIGAYPYVSCDFGCDMNADCITGMDGGSICAPFCDPTMMGTCGGIGGLPDPICDDADGDGSGDCLLDCGDTPCPEPLICAAIHPSLFACLWP